MALTAIRGPRNPRLCSGGFHHAGTLDMESFHRHNSKYDEKHQNDKVRYQEGRLGLRGGQIFQRSHLLECLHDGHETFRYKAISAVTTYIQRQLRAR